MTQIDSRIKLKRTLTTGNIPTVLTGSTDNRDGTWTALDIFPAELFVNQADKRLWIGMTDGAYEISLAPSGETATRPFYIPSGDTSTVLPTFGGHSNTDSFSSILGGSGNILTASGGYNSIGGGITNKIQGTSAKSFIGSGQYNYITGASVRSAILGGYNNEISGSSYSSIVDGQSNNTGGYDNVHIIGSNITATKANTTYVEELYVKTGGIMNDDNGTVLRKKVIDIGDWDMDATASVNVAHGLSATEWKTIRAICVIVRNDADNEYFQLDSPVLGTFGIQGGLGVINSTNIGLERLGTGQFDNTAFNSTSYNRGWITLEYTPD